MAYYNLKMEVKAFQTTLLRLLENNRKDSRYKKHFPYGLSYITQCKKDEFIPRVEKLVKIWEVKKECLSKIWKNP